MTMNHHSLMTKSDRQPLAYVWPDGIAYVFNHRIKVGQADHTLETYGFVRKPMPIKLYKFKEGETEHNKEVFPYMIKDVPTKLIEEMTALTHYREAYSKDSPTVLKGIQIEGIYVTFPNRLRITANVIHGMTLNEWHLGSDIEPLRWLKCQTLQQFIKNNNESYSRAKPVAFDVETTKENQQ